ncbi:diamine acetyltransferase 2 like protein [Danaus plexippus plexippus]|uniref:Diamine acetyltransferase 2 like protein n=1 Tax=Danaus plexippus plexippus TaxID=278856 RepID=A0A212FKE3_DANPL|nr:diamine acetyltransferase 2 like protein [Danaus plexippus plexippus]
MAAKYEDGEVKVRRSTRDDMKAVAEMIQELADLEEMSDGPKLSVQDLQRDGFDLQPPAFLCLVAEVNKDGAPLVAGYALYFPVYSTWNGQAMMLEDLYVRASERRRGLGHRLFNAVAREAHLMGSSRLDFHVLEWNKNARDFYDLKGAINITQTEKWCFYRLSGDALKKVALAAKS